MRGFDKCFGVLKPCDVEQWFNPRVLSKMTSMATIFTLEILSSTSLVRNFIPVNLISIFSPHYVGIGLASLQCINYPLPPPSPSDSQSLLDRLKRDVITDKYYGETRLPVHVCVSNTQTAKLNQKYPNKFTCT